MEEETRAWFDCLNAVAAEMEASKSFSIQTSLINVMDGAGISLKEVRWAQEQNYKSLNDSNVLISYEGVLIEREEMEENDI